MGSMLVAHAAPRQFNRPVANRLIWLRVARAVLVGLVLISSSPANSAGRANSRPTGCGPVPPTEGPYVTSGQPDDRYTSDGCFFIDGDKVARRDGWAVPLQGRLSGV